jgi:hypothetical protein
LVRSDQKMLFRGGERVEVRRLPWWVRALVRFGGAPDGLGRAVRRLGRIPGHDLRRLAVMTLKGAEGNEARSRWTVAGEAVLLVAASAVLLFFGLAAGNLSDYLAEVRPAAGGPRVWEAEALDAGWVQTLAVTSLALFAVVGFPRASRRWWRARGGVAGAMVQGLGGLWVAGGTVAAHLFLAGLYRLDPTEALAGAGVGGSRGAAVRRTGATAGPDLRGSAGVIRRRAGASPRPRPLRRRPCP